MKTTLATFFSLALIALVAGLWLGGPPISGSDAGVAASAPAGSTLGLEASDPASGVAAPGACRDATTPALPGAEELACCIDECSRDRDCRAICGKEFGGQCVQVNSCCRQCFCLGFAPTTGQPT